MTLSSNSTKSTCPYCGVGCGVEVSVTAEGTVSVLGDQDHPSNFGRLCSKGAALGETLGPQDRLLYPEVDGKRMSWEATTALIAHRFKKTIQEHGSESIAFYVSGQLLTEDYYVANKFMKGFIGTANIDTNSRLCMASSVAGHKRAFGSDTVPGTYEDLENADLITLVGSNLAWCHPVLYQRIRAAKEARPHMKVVVVDPRVTATNELADLHLPIDPDGDVHLFNGLLSYLAKSNALDQEYITEHTEGFSDLLTALGYLDLTMVSDTTGISVEKLAEFYALFEQTEKTVTVYSQGVNQSRQGTDKVNSILNCHLATGRIGKEGMGPFSVTGQPNAMGGREVGGLANMLAAHMDIVNPKHRDRVKSFWKSPQIADELGLKAIDMFDAVYSGKIKAIWIMATNPVDSLPDADRVAAALEKCPFVVVSDIYKNTDTIQYATVKLPSLGWGEKDGTVTNSERRISRQRAFLPAPGEARADWWQMAAVAKDMGFLSAFDFKSAAEIFREHADLSGLENNGERSFNINGLKDISNTEYQVLEPVQWPVKTASETNDKRLYTDGKFHTLSGKAQFIVPNDEVRAARPPRMLTLNTGRVRDHWHTMTRTARTPRLAAHIAEPFCEISFSDAKNLNIQDADLVRLENELGNVLVRALLTTRVQPGQIFVPIHWTDQFSSNARIDKLIPAITDPVSGQPASKNSIVSAEKVQMQTYVYAITRHRPSTIDADYWALAPIKGGWQIEGAFTAEISEISDISGRLGLKSTNSDVIEYGDVSTGDLRHAAFEGDRLSSFIKASSGPVEVSRTWLIDQMSLSFENPMQRYHIMSGRPSNDMPDKGAIVCSCFSVGSYEIANAVKDGFCTVSEIGKCLKAGTNCGSCKSEISTLIHKNLPKAAE